MHRLFRFVLLIMCLNRYVPINSCLLGQAASRQAKTETETETKIDASGSPPRVPASSSRLRFACSLAWLLSLVEELYESFLSFVESLPLVQPRVCARAFYLLPMGMRAKRWYGTMLPAQERMPRMAWNKADGAQ